MGGNSSKQKAEINCSPKEKKGKRKKSKKEATSNGEAGIESDQQEIEAVTEEPKKGSEVSTVEPPANVDEDSATGSGGVTAPASPDTLQDAVQQQSCISDLSTTKDKDTSEVSVTFNWTHAGKKVAISGSYNQWGDPIPLIEKDGVFELTYRLPLGEHHYKYLVDGEWTFDKDKSTAELEDHATVNVIIVSAQSSDK